MWRIYRMAIGNLKIWSIMAKEAGFAKSDSLFHSTNGGCFRPDAGVWAFQTFRFAVGTLEAPVITGVERENWKITIRWENDEDRPKASLSDRVFVGYFYGTQPRSPQLAKDLPVHRGDGSVTIDIPPAGQPDGTPLHLYLFFGNTDLTQFSTSEYMGV